MQKTSEKFEKALIAHQNGDLFEAEIGYLDYIKSNPASYDALNLLGLLKLQSGSLEEAEFYINKALTLNENAYFHENLGMVYLTKKYYSQAIEEFQKSIALDKNVTSAWFNLALAQKNYGLYDDAVRSYEMTLHLDPSLQEAYFNLAFLKFNNNEPFEAVKCYEKAVELKPDDIEAKYFLSLAYMQTKNYETGLKFFENRLCRNTAIATTEKTYPNLIKKAPIWNGEDIQDKTLYTYYEAGFGDLIMFLRYLLPLQKRCKNIVLKPQRALYSLIKENFPNIKVMDLYEQENDFDFDYHLPFLSMPFTLGLKNDEIFMNADGYLKSNSDLKKDFKEKYFNNDKFKIGIKWQGNTYYETDRVINIESFFKLFELPNTQFYSAQTFEGSEEYNKIPQKYNVINLAPSFKDFSYTAAAIDNLDLIICNDTSLAHIAGALGKPCWVILPHVYNWRWHIDTSHCDWYNSVKLFKQNKIGDWKQVFENVYDELKKYCN